MNALPLNASIWLRSIELVKLLLDGGSAADIHTPPLGSSLHLVMHVRLHAHNRYFERTTKLLLDKGADVDAQDSNNFTALMMYIRCHQAHPLIQHAARPAHLEPFVSKTKAPDKVNIFGRTALHYAALYDIPCNAIEGLLGAGAKPLVRDNLEHTPLYYSILRDGPDGKLLPGANAPWWLSCFSTLLDATPVQERPRQLSEALLAAVKTGLSSRLDAVLGEIKKGYDLDLTICDNSGYTALDIAYLFGSGAESIAQKLLNAGGNIGRGKHMKTATRWSDKDRNENLKVSGDGMEVSFTGMLSTVHLFLPAYTPGSLSFKPRILTSTWDRSAIPIRLQPVLVLGGVRADHPIPLNQGHFYFEVEVLELPESDDFYK